eukprot:TRINITY_DN600_c0_g2_i1.p1 TRINITY_DN600_c0_g2~~TRINITY_DN600_c0_g2_i1.p1  ORF type:complete len:690 (+),score=259.97 TRINITY_DN600_c0_g2_i1:61-2130(+)
MDLDMDGNPALDLTGIFDVDLPWKEWLSSVDMNVAGPVMMVAMPALMALVRRGLPTVQYQVEKIGKQVLGLNPYEVEIRYTKQEREGVYEIVSEECHQNKLLQQMIKMYVNTLKPHKEWVSSETSLMAEQEEGDDHPFTDDWEDDLMYGATSKALDCYSVVSIPECGEWVEIEKGLFFLHTEDKLEDENKNDKESTKKTIKTTDRAEVQSTLITVKLSSNSANPKAHIQGFLEKVMEWYNKRLLAKTTKAKYMYQIYQPEPKKKPKTAEAAAFADDDEEEERKYKRYRLESNKSFDTLFIPGKDELLRLVDNFLAKKDVFSKPGFPDKLGLLLYGPPGTGKTTLIKCLAKYTNRNIVNINLARVKTNQELMDIMYEMNFNVEHVDDPIKLNFDDIIFVMEDIDCASEVVRSRDGMGTESTHHDENHWDMTLTKTMTHHGSEKDEKTIETKGEGGGEEDALTKLVKNGRRRLLGLQTPGYNEEEKAEVKGKVMEILNKALKGDIDEVVEWALAKGEEDFYDDDGGEEDEEDEEGEEKEEDGEDDAEDDESVPKPKDSQQTSASDKLNLAGLLNALDGVIDTPGRIVIMTTNVQQSLDAALIRPGRVNLRIELGFMSAKEAASMFDYYFDQTDTIKRKEMRTIWVDNRFTPAEMEQMCAEHDTLDSLFTEMKKILKEFPTRASLKKKKNPA